MAFESYFKVELIFIEKIQFWTPQKGGRQHGQRPSGVMEKLHFGIKNAIFPLVFKVLQNRACAPAMKKSPKGDFLHNNHHDNVI